MDIIYQVLILEDIHPDFLNTFNRYQETHHVWYKNIGVYEQKEDYFVDEWDDDKKALVIQSLRQCISGNGKVIGAFNNGYLLGFANIEGVLFGSEKEYVELPFIHISNEHRGFGMGKVLFEHCCSEAKKLGAKKLYIAAHPSVETQGFYKSVGCIEAQEICPKIVAKEPLDIQLEKII